VINFESSLLNNFCFWNVFFILLFLVNKDFIKPENKTFDFMKLWDDNQSNYTNINDDNDNENDNISSNITLEWWNIVVHDIGNWFLIMR
jgi:hypothetical protein